MCSFLSFFFILDGLTTAHAYIMATTHAMMITNTLFTHLSLSLPLYLSLAGLFVPDPSSGPGVDLFSPLSLSPLFVHTVPQHDRSTACILYLFSSPFFRASFIVYDLEYGVCHKNN